jgi:hypothetical protein
MISIGTILKGAVLVTAFGAGFMVEHWRAGYVAASREIAYLDAAEEQAETYRLRARAYEAWKAERYPIVTEFKRSIQREIDNHRSWSDEPLPDGVRRTAEEAPDKFGAAEPGGSVPAVSGASAPNQR